MSKDLIRDLTNRKKYLNKQILGLECSDDKLYSDANGNYSRYNELKLELRMTEKRIEKLKAEYK